MKSDDPVRVSITKKESGTGSENEHNGNALEVILMTDDGNKKPEKSAKSKSEEKPDKKPKKKQKKPLNAVKSPSMSEKDSKLVKKYNRKYFGQSMIKLRPSKFNFRNEDILI